MESADASAASDLPEVARALTRLLDDAHLAVPDDMAKVVARAAAAIDAHVVIYLVEYDQRNLVRLSEPRKDEIDKISLEGTVPGRVFRELRPQVVERDGRRRVWVPLIDGTERLGVLGLTVADDRDVEAPQWRDAFRWFATLTAHLLAAKAPFGDALEMARREIPRTLAAELLWQLLPPLTFGTDGFVVTCVLEPAAQVAGDAFDYAVSTDKADLAMFDGTGHDLTSGLVTSVAIAANRNGRRNGAPLQDRVRLIDETIGSQFGHERFVTGVQAELDRSSGMLRYVNSGHPVPLLIRRGKVVKRLSDGRRPLLGLNRPEVPVAEEQLEPGDWLVLYTDGVTEARDPAGSEFGERRLVDFLERAVAAEQPPPETLRRLVHSILSHQNDVLQDDATVLLAQWRTGAEDAFFAE
jgi:serine phosphatase RsbU (regulator of sigma subunit)